MALYNSEVFPGKRLQVENYIQIKRNSTTGHPWFSLEVTSICTGKQFIMHAASTDIKYRQELLFISPEGSEC